MTASTHRDDRGAVTAELALGIPMLSALVLALVWMISLGATQVLVIDAARETARALARGESEPSAIELGKRVAPGAGIEVTHEGGVVVVRVRATASSPPGLLGALPRPVVESQAVASMEGQ